MQSWTRLALGALCAVAFALSGVLPAAAQAPPPGFIIGVCENGPPASEASDHQAVMNAFTATNAGGYAGLAAHLYSLREVMARAPSCYPMIERRGDTILVRTDDNSRYLLLAAVASHAVSSTENRPISTEMSNNTYPLAALLLASYAVEMRQYDEGIAWLDRGLALQPDNEFLILERVAALMGAQRFEECVALLQASLDNEAMALTLDRPRFLRSLGVALIDLARLDEAEAALQESLRLSPGDPRTQGELDYIEQLRRGERERDIQLTSPVPQPPQTQN